jgi:hypothetical protein
MKPEELRRMGIADKLRQVIYQVDVVDLPDGVQPDQLVEDELRGLPRCDSRVTMTGASAKRIYYLRLYQAPSGLRPSAPFLLGDISDN